LPPVAVAAVVGAASDYWVGWASGQYGWLGGLTLALLVAVLAAVGWFRRTLPVDAPLQRTAFRALLMTGLICAATSLVVHGTAATGTLSVASVAVLLATLLPAASPNPAMTLLGTGCVGTGLAGVGAGVAALLDQHTLDGVALTGAGLALVGLGVAALLDRQTLLGVAAIGAGLAAIAAAVARLRPALRVVGARARARWRRATSSPTPGPDD